MRTGFATVKINSCSNVEKLLAGEPAWFIRRWRDVVSTFPNQHLSVLPVLWDRDTLIIIESLAYFNSFRVSGGKCAVDGRQQNRHTQPAHAWTQAQATTPKKKTGGVLSLGSTCGSCNHCFVISCCSRTYKRSTKDSDSERSKPFLSSNPHHQSRNPDSAE